MASNSHRRARIERLLAQRDAEGLTFKALAVRSGIPIGTLSHWSYKLRRAARPDRNRARFAELVDRSPEVPHEIDRATPDSAIRIEHPSGLVIEFSGGVADAALERLLTAEDAPWS